MKIQTLLLISITASFVLSLATTLASYYIISPSDPRILDVAWVYRGWPLHWIIESWSYWSPPPYPHQFTFQPVNFLIDFLFYAIVFQIPMQLYLYSKEAKKPTSQKKQHKPNPETLIVETINLKFPIKTDAIGLMLLLFFKKREGSCFLFLLPSFYIINELSSRTKHQNSFKLRYAINFI